MKKYIIIVLALSLLLFVCFVSYSQNLELKKYPSSKAVELAGITDRQIVILVTAKGCSGCQSFKDDTLSDSGVIKTLNDHFIVSDVVLGGDSSPADNKFNFPEGTELAIGDMSDFLGLQYVPYSLFLYPDLSGRPLFFFGALRPRLYQDYLEYFSRWDRTSFSFVKYIKGISEEKDCEYFNYREEIKKISQEEFSFIEDSKLEFKVLRSPAEERELESLNEVILNFSSPEEAESYARTILDRCLVKKVFLVDSK